MSLHTSIHTEQVVFTAQPEPHLTHHPAGRGLSTKSSLYHPCRLSYKYLHFHILPMPCRQGRLYSGLYSNSIPDAATLYPSTSYLDDMALACMWLWQRTGVATLLSEAQTYLQQHEAQETTVGAALRRAYDAVCGTARSQPHLAEAALQASKSSDGFSWGIQTPVAAKAVTVRDKWQHKISKFITGPQSLMQGGYGFSWDNQAPAAQLLLANATSFQDVNGVTGAA